MSENNTVTENEQLPRPDITGWLGSEGIRYNQPGVSEDMRRFAFELHQNYLNHARHIPSYIHLPEDEGFSSPDPELLLLAQEAYLEVPKPIVISWKEYKAAITQPGFRERMQAYIHQPGHFGTYVAVYIDKGEQYEGRSLKSTATHGNAILIGQQIAMPHYISDGNPIKFTSEPVPCPFTGEYPYIMDDAKLKPLEYKFNTLIRKGKSHLAWIPANDILAHLRSAGLSKSVELHNPNQLENRNIDFFVYPAPGLIMLGLTMQPFLNNTDTVSNSIYGNPSGVDTYVVLDANAFRTGQEWLLAQAFVAKSRLQDFWGRERRGIHNRKMDLRNPIQVLKFITSRHLD